MIPNALFDSRSNPESRAVLEDAQLDRGETPRRLGVLLWIAADDAAADDAIDTATDADADTADTDATDATDVDAAAYDAAADDAAIDTATDADAAADDARRQRLNAIITKELEMTPGLKLVQLPGRYYSVTRVGWLRRVSGDEWQLIGAVTLVRRSGYRSLGDLAANGPAKDHEVRPRDEAPEEIHRLLIRRCLVANQAAWKAHCPKPKDWEES